MMLERRKCPVCSSEEKQTVNHQCFSSLAGINKDFEQVVVVCKKCGMSYVDSYLSDKDLATYYSTMSNYEYISNGQVLPIAEINKAIQQFRYISFFADKKFDNVLDIGCSLGYTLSLFKKKGSSVLGIEPSSINKSIAKQLYDVDIMTCFFDKEINLEGCYDLIILSHIVEHMKHPAALLTSLSKITKESSLIYIEVPSIECFDERDMFQFNIEHINYFSHSTLASLMHVAGFEEVDHIIHENSPSIAPHYPTLGTLWRKSNTEYPLINHYNRNVSCLLRYKKTVDKLKESISREISIAIKPGSRVAIWGAGAMTSQLLTFTSLSNSNVKVVFDSNSKKDGLSILNIPIKKPSNVERTLSEFGLSHIIIGSWSSQKEIFNHLLSCNVPKEAIVKLFPEI